MHVQDNQDRLKYHFVLFDKPFKVLKLGYIILQKLYPVVGLFCIWSCNSSPENEHIKLSLLH